MVLTKLLHIFCKRKCLAHLTLDDDWIICSKCKAKIGFICALDDKWYTFIFPNYYAHSKMIEVWSRSALKPELANHSKNEWVAMVDELKQQLQDSMLCTDTPEFHTNDLDEEETIINETEIDE